MTTQKQNPPQKTPSNIMKLSKALKMNLQRRKASTNSKKKPTSEN
jgi:non-homologous end joining protein Ku